METQRSFVALIIILSFHHMLASKNNCNSRFKNNIKGEIDFGNHGSDQTDQGHCLWIIEMQKGSKIALSIINLNIGNDDLLVLTDYETNGTVPIQNRTFHAVAPRTVIFSQADILIIELKFTNISKILFNAVFEEAKCGGIISSPSGIIEVPLFAHFSPSTKTCSWEIQAPEEKLIKISFLQFSLPPGSCINENMVIKDGNAVNEQLIGDFCEETPPMGDVASSSSIATIDYTKRLGFSAEVMLDSPKIRLHYEFFDPCMSELTGMFGSIVVLDTVYTKESDCSWQVKVPKSYVISLKFLKYTTLHRSDGGRQVMYIYDEISGRNASLLWTSADDRLPPSQLLTSANKLRIEMKIIKNASKSSRIRFNAVYQAQENVIQIFDECIIMGNSRFYQCTNGHYIDCDWKCDGESDCSDGIDELFCSNDVSGFDITQVKIKPLEEIGGLLMVFVVAGSAILACVFVLSLDKLMKLRVSDLTWNQQSMDKKMHSFVAYQLPSLPPYSANDPCVTPPPPYQVQQIENALLKCIKESSEEGSLCKKKMEDRNLEADVACDDSRNLHEEKK